MGDANENRNNSTSASSRSTSNKSRVMESLSLEINKYPRDLLQRSNVSSAAAAGGAHHPGKEEEEDDDDGDEEGIELNLGLSLGGRFGVEKSSYSNSAYSYFKKKKKLTRSSSIAGTIPLLREDDLVPFGVVNKTEMMAAENVRAAAAVAGYHQRPVLMRSSSLPAATEEEWRKRKEMQSLRRMEAKRRRSEKQQRGILELERSSIGGETRSSANILSLQERINQEAVGSSVTRTNENLNKLNSAEMDNPSNRGREIVTNSVEDMPCVFTKGEGPNGRRVDGILYKYGKGEEVRIMCICHGMFHSPAEFVKHAGGGNVDHPLRHIVVNPSGPSL